MFDKSLKAATGTTRFIRHGHACLGVAAPAGLTLTAGDVNHSLLWSRNGTGSGKTHTWSPYGKGNPTDGLPGFNGERPDPVSGAYHLGNGYRAYNPVLRRFNCPDSMSPFGAGGINPYAYCLGDPVNRTDPTGHISWQGILGIVTGAIGLGLSLFTAGASIAAAGSISVALSSASRLGLTIGLIGVAADVTSIASGATEDVNPEASSVLGWVSMATGIAGMGIGLAQLPKGIKAARSAWNHKESVTGISYSHNTHIRAEKEIIIAKYNKFNRDLSGYGNSANPASSTFFDPDNIAGDAHLSFDSDFLLITIPPSRVPYTRTSDISGATSYISNNSPLGRALSVSDASHHIINSENSSGHRFINDMLDLKQLRDPQAINIRARSIDAYSIKGIFKFRASMLSIKTLPDVSRYNVNRISHGSNMSLSIW
ncbi:RHS repeat-associated core domain-containing protein [Enterobacter ludwigii]